MTALEAGDELDEIEVELSGMSQLLSMASPAESTAATEMLAKFLERAARRDLEPVR